MPDLRDFIAKRKETLESLREFGEKYQKFVVMCEVGDDFLEQLTNDLDLLSKVASRVGHLKPKEERHTGDINEIIKDIIN